ncbi:S8 family serine peptidase [Telluria mixta]|uniref:S8 family serine peptidase n=1 Tax=Telluria mixta TaxID=34071 RepID=A0ABT2BWZ1_9BURK|nr:S8 family serine peptidase [Telluria mixta]MCS0629462.1 S8 family serine peptidase [Telluria mixta]WEM96962.1 S8 family serine peptidase [Telluria mixta]
MNQKYTRASKMVPALGLCVAALAVAFSGSVSAAPDTTRVIVAFKPGSAANIKSAVAAARGTVKLEIFNTNAMAIEVPTAALQGLQRNPNVEYVEEDVVRKPFALKQASIGASSTAQVVPYGIKQVQADQLSDANTSNRKICIIDSGVDFSHEDLKDNGTNVTGEYDSGTGWWYTDETHHGTHVFGSIAAVNNGLGVVGVNPNKQLKLHIVKVFGKDGAWTYSSTLANAANKCDAAGANVITMSLGGGARSVTEQRVFDNLQTKGVLSIAAAGNDGNSTTSYPAGYASVMSVAAVDENKVVASFSQYNKDVEIAGPGVAVLSTVPMGTGVDTALTVGSTNYASSAMEGSPVKTATAPLADFGIGDKVNTAVSGKVCLIQRGTIDFATKVSNCQSSGGVGAIVYNNVAGGFGGTLGTTVTSIPSLTASDTDGAAMKTQLGQSATVAVTASNYAYFDGTSMATPHVSAVAALVWSYFPTCTGAQIRTSLDNSALDLGTAGRDTKYGYGLVQAKAAYDRIKALGCGK